MKTAIIGLQSTIQVVLAKAEYNLTKSEWFNGFDYAQQQRMLADSAKLRL